MPRVKQASKPKRTTKAAAVRVLGAAGVGLSLVGSASASAMPATIDFLTLIETQRRHGTLKQGNKPGNVSGWVPSRGALTRFSRPKSNSIGRAC